MNDELRSYESTITFMQKEHERVLHGLHMEIERLQQKCSGNIFRENENYWRWFTYHSVEKYCKTRSRLKIFREINSLVTS